MSLKSETLVTLNIILFGTNLLVSSFLYFYFVLEFFCSIYWVVVSAQVWITFSKRLLNNKKHFLYEHFSRWLYKLRSLTLITIPSFLSNILYLDAVWIHFVLNCVRYWDCEEVKWSFLGHFWVTFGSLLGYFWVTFGLLLDYFLGYFWVILTTFEKAIFLLCKVDFSLKSTLNWS